MGILNVVAKRRLTEFYSNPNHHNWKVRNVALFYGVSENIVRETKRKLGIKKQDNWCHCEEPIIDFNKCSTCGNKIEEIDTEYRMQKQKERYEPRNLATREEVVSRISDDILRDIKPILMSVNYEDLRRFTKLHPDRQRTATDKILSDDTLSLKEAMDLVFREYQDERQRNKKPDEYWSEWRRQYYHEHKVELREKKREYENRKREERKMLNRPVWMLCYPVGQIETKKCKKCGKEFPLNEMFFNYLEKEERWLVNCIECAHKLREQGRKEREKKCAQKPPALPPLTPEQKKERARQKSREWYQANREKKLEQDRIRQNSPEGKRKRKEYMQTAKGRELKAKGRKSWKQNRRAREKGLEASFTAKQWEESKSFFNGCCAYCGKKADMTMDHFIAVANGGEYSRDNIIPACHDCNSDKSANDFFDWYPVQPFYSKMREKRILKYLNYQAEGLQQRTLLG